ncbi:hypothetical protein CASFOL_023803 [Castilleja foliolosa]|uniref:Uncharacterized protein n=1 Tax=Castilleja foliolosa TaxID=1961234 RepID=A0ABD3CNL0_9LAMI
MQFEDLKENFEEINDRFENTIQEKSKLVNDLVASEERYKMQIEDLEAKYEELKISVEEKNKLVKELVNWLEASRDKNERYKMLNNELEMTMKEERNNLVNELTSTLREVSDNYEKQIEDLMAKNEKNERTLNDLIWGDWKLVEEQEEQQLDHNYSLRFIKIVHFGHFFMFQN